MKVIDVDEFGVLLKVHSSYRPPIKQIEKVEKALNKLFPNNTIEWFGNNDANTIFLMFGQVLNKEERQLLFKEMVKFDK